MTREEAIDIIKCLAWHTRPDEEYVEQAIKVLDQQPCEMTVDEYRNRLMDAFHNADCGELIAVVVRPEESEFKQLEWLLKNHYHNQKQQPCDDCISRQSVKRKLQEHHDLFINAYGGRVGFKSMADAKEKARVDEINNCISMVVNEPPVTPKQQPCEDVISRDCDKCAYYDNGANDEACDGCFADEYEHPNFKPKAQHYEDCISRQAVDELSKELVHTTRDKADFLCNFWEGLQKLPPVTQKEKTAHWINKTLIYKGETEGERDCYAGTCSACGGVQECWNYCGGCGARMVSE